jgi:hypothetical protein
MGWASKPVYPVETRYAVTVKTTGAQRMAWKDAARKYGKGTTGGFLEPACLDSADDPEQWLDM